MKKSTAEAREKLREGFTKLGLSLPGLRREIGLDRVVSALVKSYAPNANADAAAEIKEEIIARLLAVAEPVLSGLANGAGHGLTIRELLYMDTLHRYGLSVKEVAEATGAPLSVVTEALRLPARAEPGQRRKRTALDS